MACFTSTNFYRVRNVVGLHHSNGNAEAGQLGQPGICDEQKVEIITYLCDIK
jgi:hypothetical protein